MKTKQQLEAEEVTNRLLKAYRAVFGLAGRRTEAQKLVVADMERRGYVNKPIFVQDGTGAVCPLRAAIADGRRGFATETLQMADSKPSADDKPKPKVKR